MTSICRSAAQIEASRRNGTRSHGPTTPEGKAKAARNSLRHGLRAQRFLLLEGEDLAAVDHLFTATRRSLAPADAAEEQLAESVAAGFVRQCRADRLEAEVLEGLRRRIEATSCGEALVLDPEGLPSLVTVLRYRAQTESELRRHLDLLLKLKQARRAGLLPDEDDADHTLPALAGSPAAWPSAPAASHHGEQDETAVPASTVQGAFMPVSEAYGFVEPVAGEQGFGEAVSDSYGFIIAPDVEGYGPAHQPDDPRRDLDRDWPEGGWSADGADHPAADGWNVVAAEGEPASWPYSAAVESTHGHDTNEPERDGAATGRGAAPILPFPAFEAAPVSHVDTNEPEPSRATPSTASLALEAGCRARELFATAGGAPFDWADELDGWAATIPAPIQALVTRLPATLRGHLAVMPAQARLPFLTRIAASFAAPGGSAAGLPDQPNSQSSPSQTSLRPISSSKAKATS